MRFDPSDLGLLSDIEEVRIETARPGGPPHRTIIWVVVDGEDVFIRSVNGADARWYRESIAEPVVTIHADGRSIRARVAPAIDAASVKRTSDALKRKYAHDPAVASMLKPDILDTTLRLEPDPG